ncbi:putative feruloyl esterase B-1 OS=Aspergillus oryzae (strain ATCC 42149 / RIB 40) GN=faeB-1 PE=3 SV=1 [Rhizoctonia solani AG-1 IB]|uniref:Carboxylic ester hydrolase n=1 Tax=Thanatephorus cucumeris (strain AG1-IB / isolate 7/3/14) TaxID=1108050 RepID=A0A0B7FET1_THACB|nr:putative feruloyl esterase B-1 OS=Aspergillus oryzae (strain ATCC 42149 / RIB 40) GN=faeB-1 PE=3 SV=1 [Rhizoctonia solani AG-1 IB]
MHTLSKWLPVSALLYAASAKPLDCAGLFNTSKTLIKGLNPFVSEIHPANVTFVPVGNVAYPNPVPDLPEFCRFGAEYNTSTTSKFRFEVWLPNSGSWNGRFAFVGNGGDAGGVNNADMAIPMSKYGFAVASTDTGHTGTGGDGTFAISNPESQIDFGHRAVHLSTVFSKIVTNAYYGKKAKYNYWIGCSSGGKQGVKSAQMYPEDFDGVVAGAPAQWWPHLNGFTMHINLLNANATTPGAVIPTSFFTALNQEVVAQCDKLDGVTDGIIANPRKCKPDLTRVACGSTNSSPYVNASNCLSDSQLVTLKAIYTNWTSSSGEFLFPTFEPGSEFGWPQTINGIPYGPAPDFFSYQVLNKTSVQTLQINETELQRLTAIGDATDPGQTNAINPNLRPFFKRGGKLLQYHGFADPLIPSGSSLWYYEHVRTFFKNEDLKDRYRLFMLPGYGHCSGGPGANSFGGPGQRSLSQGGSGQSRSFTPQYDMILATMNWVEKGVAPKSLIGAKYNQNNITQGPAFTQLYCPYPQEAIYRGGDVKAASSYLCGLPA